MRTLQIKEDQLDHLKRVLLCIAEGYRNVGRDDRFIIVENPEFREDRGNDPFLVLDVWNVFRPPLAEEE